MKLKKIIGLFTALTMCFGVTGDLLNFDGLLSEREIVNAEDGIEIWDGSSDTSWYDEGEEELHISSAEELAGLIMLVNNGKTMSGQTIVFDEDIYLNDISDYDSWKSTPPQNKWSFKNDTKCFFAGTIDANNHSVIGLYSNYGLLYQIKEGTIKNIKLDNAYINNLGGHVGGIVSIASKSTISNCETNGQMYIDESKGTDTNSNFGGGYRKGGICGLFYSTTVIENCTNKIKIIVETNMPDFEMYKKIKSSKGVGDYTPIIGGIAGGVMSTDKCSITNCINYGDIISEGYCECGGIVGYGFIIERCVNLGNITENDYVYPNKDTKEFRELYGDITNTEYGMQYYNFAKGGIAGEAKRVTACYNIGDAPCGISYCATTISNCYNIGKAKKFSITYTENTIENTYYLSGTAESGNPGKNTAIAKNAANMKKEAFAKALGENFVYVKDNYPKLKWEISNTPNIEPTIEPSPSVPVKTKGDTNNDNKIDSSDLITLQKWFFGETAFSPEIAEIVDYNSDGKINIADFCLLKEAIIKAK